MNARRVQWRDLLGAPSWWWGVVETTSPLTVTREGEDSPVPASVLAHVGALSVGARVWCQRSSDRTVIVYGKAA